VSGPLASLERALARELDLLGLPSRSWTARVPGPDGTDLLDVVVVGAGMCGTAAAGALMLRGISNLTVVDRADAGTEGPWLTTARMQTLRSPKFLPGVDLGLPSLTFRAWFTARSGEAAWDSLGKIRNSDWVDYLLWVRGELHLPVRSRAGVTGVRPADGHVEVRLGSGEVLRARRVVMATGRLGVGGPFVPAGVDARLGPDRVVHASAPIDFRRLAGWRVAVVGGGPSGWDNAAAALEAGAARVDLYVRRTVLPQVNKFRASATAGFFEGWPALPVADRWRLICFLDDHDTPPPHESVLRALALPGLQVHLGTPLLSAAPAGAGVTLVLGPDGRRAAADFLVLATGYDVDLAKVPELADLAPYAATWGDAYQPPTAMERADRARFPFLGDGFELTEKVPGACPALGRVHLFNHGAFASLGVIASDIPGVSFGAARLATRIIQAFFAEDLGHVLAELAAFDEPELAETPFFSAQEVQVQRTMPVWPRRQRGGGG
jgi:cation diffusion facilitator CzcD-associated flavoprotein CzcO